MRVLGVRFVGGSADNRLLIDKIKTMKTLKELYTILYNEIKDKTTIYGLCGCIYDLGRDEVITRKEREKLMVHFKSQKELHPEFMTKKRNWMGGMYWWAYKEDNNPINRIAFVKKLMDTVE